MILFLFLDNWFALFDSCFDCTNFFHTAEIVIPTQTSEVNAEIEIQIVTVEAKISKCLK